MAAAQEPTANATSVPLPEIPVKLRCTICGGLAQGAVRLPCCEQSICENCRASLPNVCPVCDHSPLSADDCKPNAALRTTVAVFIRTQEKKHALSLQKQKKICERPIEVKLEAKVPDPPKAVEHPTIQEVKSASPVQKVSTPTLPLAEAADTNQPGPTGGEAHPPAHAPVTDESQPSAPPDAVNAGPSSEMAPNASQQNGYSDGQQPSQQAGWFNHQQQQPDQMAQMQHMYGRQDFSGASGWGPYGQMMPDMSGAWNNGYGNNMIGYNPMMMNPMAMQSGYNGGDFGSMGPGGAGGFNGGQGGNGMGWSNGWNGVGNMGYNPGMNGMRNGGYYSAASAGGYNHQSHGNHQVPAQQFQNPHFQRQQNFPRGGNAGFGGGQNRPFTADQSQPPQSHSSQSSQSPPQQQQPYIAATNGIEQANGIVNDAADSPEGGDQFSQQLQGIEQAVAAVKSADTGEKQGEKKLSVVPSEPGDIAADYKEVPTDSSSTVIGGVNGPAANAMDPSSSTATSVNQSERAQSVSVGDVNGQSIPTVPQQPQQQQQFHPGYRGGFRGNYRGGFRGGYPPGFRGPGSFPTETSPIPSIAGSEKKPIEPVAQGVPGAPTGPKAMREGLPNRGMIRGRGGFAARGGFGGGSSWSRSMSPNENNERDRGRSYSRSVDSRRRSKSPSRDRSRDRRRSRDRERDHSRARHRSRDHSPRRRRRSPSYGSDGGKPRARTPKHEEEKEPVAAPPAGDVLEIPVEQDSASKEAPAPSVPGRGKRSRETSESRAKSKSASRSRSRSGERRHKRSRRHRRHTPSPERDHDRDNRREKRSHKHRSRRHRRSRTRSLSPSRELKKGDYSDDDRATVRDEDGADKRDRRDSKTVERRHKRRSRREDSRERHRSHRHKSSRHERHDRHRDYDRDDDDKLEEREADESLDKTGEKPVEKGTEKRERKSRNALNERKPSYKYEDEGDLERQAERDREAERWGIK